MPRVLICDIGVLQGSRLHHPRGRKVQPLRPSKAAPKEAFTTKLSVAGLKVAEESMQEFKLIARPVPWKELVDQSLLPSELRVDLPA